MTQFVEALSKGFDVEMLFLLLNGDPVQVLDESQKFYRLLQLLGEWHEHGGHPSVVISAVQTSASC